jgi:hypothetical protein
MAAAAHNPAFAKKLKIPQGVARDFNKADVRTGILRKKRGLAKPRPGSDGGIGGR